MYSIATYTTLIYFLFCHLLFVYIPYPVRATQNRVRRLQQLSPPLLADHKSHGHACHVPMRKISTPRCTRRWEPALAHGALGVEGVCFSLSELPVNKLLPSRLSLRGHYGLVLQCTSCELRLRLRKESR